MGLYTAAEASLVGCARAKYCDERVCVSLQNCGSSLRQFSPRVTDVRPRPGPYLEAGVAMIMFFYISGLWTTSYVHVMGHMETSRCRRRCSEGWPWESVHRGKWGQLIPPGKMDEKLKNENMQKEQFSMFMLYFESNQGRQV